MVDPPRRDVAAGTASSASMLRSEEELVTTTRLREVGRVRLRKRVVTEDVTVTVTLRKEVIALEEEPISDGELAGSEIGPDGDEEIFDMVRFEEEFVIEKRIVPKERVRLVKSVVLEDKTYSEDVRREQIEVQGGGLRPDA